MPRFKVSLRMAHDTTWPERRRWSNTFHVEAAHAHAAAEQVLQGWVDHLRGATRTTVFCYEVYSTDAIEGTDNYVVLPVPVGQQRGSLLPPSNAEPYLAKACMSVNLNVLMSRPSRKFWRPGLYEQDIYLGIAINDTLAGTLVAALGGFVTFMGSNLVDPDGEVINSVGKYKLTTREFGRTAGMDVPVAPAVG